MSRSHCVHSCVYGTAVSRWMGVKGNYFYISCTTSHQGRRMRIQPTALKPRRPVGTQQVYHWSLFPKLLPAVKRPLVLCLMLEGLTIDETPAKQKKTKRIPREAQTDGCHRSNIQESKTRHLQLFSRTSGGVTEEGVRTGLGTVEPAGVRPSCVTTGKGCGATRTP